MSVDDDCTVCVTYPAAVLMHDMHDMPNRHCSTLTSVLHQPVDMISIHHLKAFQMLSARLRYPQCVSNGDTQSGANPWSYSQLSLLHNHKAECLYQHNVCLYYICNETQFTLFILHTFSLLICMKR